MSENEVREYVIIADKDAADNLHARVEALIGPTERPVFGPSKIMGIGDQALIWFVGRIGQGPEYITAPGWLASEPYNAQFGLTVKIRTLTPTEVNSVRPLLQAQLPKGGINFW